MQKAQSACAEAGSRACARARVAAMGGKGKAHRIHGNDGQLHNAHGGWFLRHRSKRRLSVYVRRRFLFLPSLSSINTLPHQQKSINRRVINRHRNHCRVCIASALIPSSDALSPSFSLPTKAQDTSSGCVAGRPACL